METSNALDELVGIDTHDDLQSRLLLGESNQRLFKIFQLLRLNLLGGQMDADQ